MKPVKNVNVSESYKEEDYQNLLHETIAVIESSRVRIAKQINATVMSSHWEIGRLLEERKLDSKHGDNIVKRLSVDLKAKYPTMGLLPRNLWDMKRFYLRYYQEDIKLRRCVAVLPWRHNLLLLNYNLSSEHVLFYANEVISKGWSRDMLNLALKSEYHLSLQASEKSNNFAVTMSALQDVHKPIGVAEFQYLLPKNKLEEMITNEIKNRGHNI